jgi:uncharacterized protein YkwD
MGRRLLATSLALAALGVGLLGAAPAGADSLSALIAPGSACAGQTNTGLTISERERAMLCMTNFARDAAGLPPLSESTELDRSSARKSDDILRCDSFSHEACGRPFTYWMQRVGYIPARCWRAGENIAWGTGSYGTVRSIFTAWIHSPDHRENILGPYRQVGIGVDAGGLDGHRDAQVWTQHFGAHC